MKATVMYESNTYSIGARKKMALVLTIHTALKGYESFEYRTHPTQCLLMYH